jgi:hypothetical protein
LLTIGWSAIVSQSYHIKQLPPYMVFTMTAANE